jgi:hypothetical protein
MKSPSLIAQKPETKSQENILIVFEMSEKTSTRRDSQVMIVPHRHREYLNKD